VSVLLVIKLARFAGLALVDDAVLEEVMEGGCWLIRLHHLDVLMLYCMAVAAAGSSVV
jgi:hypothetical protein